jgi:hypothetical protein
MSEDAACPSNIIAQSTPAPSIPAVPHDGHDPVVDASASYVLADAISAETFYNNASRSVRALLVLCYGLNRDDGTPAIDVCMPPWSGMTKATLRVAGKDYQAEISRRWGVMCMTKPELRSQPPPRPSQWNISKAQMWLIDNPVSNAVDRAFIFSAIEEREEAAKANKATSAPMELFNKKWLGKEPILRLIHTVVDNDEIKRAYLQRFDLPSDRMVLENRNTPEALAACCWTMMAEKWNDPYFSACTMIMSELHSDFALPIVIDHDLVSDMAPATPEKVKDKWSSLVHELKRKIEKWEMSGQGDGGHMTFDFEEDDELNCGMEDDLMDEPSAEPRPKPAFGQLSNRPRTALDSRSAFFRDKESYLLYFWEVLDKNNLMVSSMQRLENRVAATNGADGIPSVIGKKRKPDDSSVTTGGGSDGDSNYRSSTQKIAQLSETISEHGTKMLAVAKMKVDQRDKELSYAKQAEARNSIRTLGSEKRQLMIQMLAEKAKNNRAMEQVYADAIAEIDQKLEQENILLAESSTTPPKSNRSPSSNGQSGGLDRSLIE